jgi:hypothetical protein
MNGLQQYPNPSSKKATTLKIIIAILVLLVISGVAYGGWKILGKKGVELIKPGSITNWRTYSNEKWSFSIQYPEGWVVKEGIEFTSVETNELIYEGVRFSPAPEKSPYIDILKYENPQNLSAKEWAVWFYGKEDPTYQSIVVNGIEGLRKDTIVEKGEALFSDVILAKSGKAFEIKFMFVPRKEILGKGIAPSPDEWRAFWEKLLNTIEIN